MTDEITKALRNGLAPAKLSRELAENAEKAADDRLESIRRGEIVVFDKGFYEKAREQARHWSKQAGVYTELSVLVPSGLFGASMGVDFPDMDISTLGIGNHRFFLFHSGMAVWVMRKMYEAYLNRSGDSDSHTDRIVKKILGVVAGSAAFGVGIHLLIDTVQPKSVVFPFFGSLVNGTLVDDNLWLFGNSLWCFKMSHDFFALALGEDLPKAQAYVDRAFLQPVKEGLVDAFSRGNRPVEER